MANKYMIRLGNFCTCLKAEGKISLRKKLMAFMTKGLNDEKELARPAHLPPLPAPGVPLA
jgi:hypothetical protein